MFSLLIAFLKLVWSCCSVDKFQKICLLYEGRSPQLTHMRSVSLDLHQQEVVPTVLQIEKFP